MLPPTWRVARLGVLCAARVRKAVPGGSERSFGQSPPPRPVILLRIAALLGIAVRLGVAALLGIAALRCCITILLLTKAVVLLRSGAIALLTGVPVIVAIAPPSFVGFAGPLVRSVEKSMSRSISALRIWFTILAPEIIKGERRRTSA